MGGGELAVHQMDTNVLMINGSLTSQMGGTAAGPYVNNLTRAITSLDVQA